MPAPSAGVRVEDSLTAPSSRSRRYILGLLLAGCLVNFYDLALPAVVLESIKREFSVSDAGVGALASAFVLVAGLGSLVIGRLADRMPRRTVIGVSVLSWSIFTAVSGFMTTLGGFVAARIGVAAAQSSYLPVAGALVADLYPSERRATASSIYLLGYPVGTFLAFFTAGGLTVAFDSWRAPFLIAAVPGAVVAVLLLKLREPGRGACEPGRTTGDAVGTARRGTVRALMRTKSMYGLILAFAGYNLAAYALGTFLTPVLQRYYGLDLLTAGAINGGLIGTTGVVGLVVGGRLLDRAAEWSIVARVNVAATSLAGAAVLSFVGLLADRGALWQLVVFLGGGYVLGFTYLAASVACVADVVEPASRSTAFGLVSAFGFFIGGAGGPIIVGALSDWLAIGSSLSPDAASAEGLQMALLLFVPNAWAFSAVGLFVVGSFIDTDNRAMLDRRST